MSQSAWGSIERAMWDAVTRVPTAEEERARLEKLEATRLEQAVLVHAQQLLAERDMPDDLKQFAIEARLYNWALMVWQSGYSAGMRAVIARKAPQ